MKPSIAKCNRALFDFTGAPYSSGTTRLVGKGVVSVSSRGVRVCGPGLPRLPRMAAGATRTYRNFAHVASDQLANWRNRDIVCVPRLLRTVRAFRVRVVDFSASSSDGFSTRRVGNATVYLPRSCIQGAPKGAGIWRFRGTARPCNRNVRVRVPPMCSTVCDPPCRFWKQILIFDQRVVDIKQYWSLKEPSEFILVWFLALLIWNNFVDNFRYTIKMTSCRPFLRRYRKCLSKMYTY